MMDHIDFICSMPKAELHLHLKGAISPETIVSLWDKYAQYLCKKDELFIKYLEKNNRYKNLKCFNSLKIELEDIKYLFLYESFHNFLATFGTIGFLIREKEDLELLITNVISNLVVQKVIYVEITISIIEYMQSGMNLVDILECLEKVSERKDIAVFWIIDLIRNSGPCIALSLFEMIEDYSPACIVGFTLGGDENSYKTCEFKTLYDQMHKHHYCTSIHCGEVGPAKNIWDAIQYLNVERIGHGIKAINDLNLLKILRELYIPLEVCISSNVALIPECTYLNHPILELYKQGLCVTINTDDPTFFNTTLTKEYLNLHSMGFSLLDIISVAENAFLFSFAPNEKKEHLLSIFRNKIKQMV